MKVHGTSLVAEGLEDSPRERNDNPLQYSCLENLRHRGSWWVIVLGFAKSWTGLRTHSLALPCSNLTFSSWILNLLLIISSASFMLFLYFWPCWVFVVAQAFLSGGAWLLTRWRLWWSLGSGTQVLAGSRAQARMFRRVGLLLHGLWDLLGPGIKFMSPALAGRFFTTEPPGKPTFHFIFCIFYLQKFDF